MIGIAAVLALSAITFALLGSEVAAIVFVVLSLVAEIGLNFLAAARRPLQEEP